MHSNCLLFLIIAYINFTKINTQLPTEVIGNPSAPPSFQPLSHYSFIFGGVWISRAKTEGWEGTEFSFTPLFTKVNYQQICLHYSLDTQFNKTTMVKMHINVVVQQIYSTLKKSNLVSLTLNSNVKFQNKWRLL